MISAFNVKAYIQRFFSGAPLKVSAGPPTHWKHAFRHRGSCLIDNTKFCKNPEWEPHACKKIKRCPQQVSIETADLFSLTLQMQSYHCVAILPQTLYMINNGEDFVSSAGGCGFSKPAGINFPFTIHHYKEVLYSSDVSLVVVIVAANWCRGFLYGSECILVPPPLLGRESGQWEHCGSRILKQNPPTLKKYTASAISSQQGTPAGGRKWLRIASRTEDRWGWF